METKRPKLRFTIEEGSYHGQNGDQVGRWYIVDRELDKANKTSNGLSKIDAVEMAAQLNINYGYGMPDVAERTEL